MERCIRDLEKNFDEGLNRMNWTALGIPDYGNMLMGVIGQFEGVVSQVNKIAKDLRARVIELKIHRLFKEPPYKKLSLPVLDCWVDYQSTYFNN
jgi:hypothetical protein